MTQKEEFLSLEKTILLMLQMAIVIWEVKTDKILMNISNIPQEISDLKRCFCLDELIYSYYNGELEIFLDKIGEHEKAEQIRNISKNNALLLIRLYEIFNLQYEDSEETIRNDYASVQ